MSGEVLLRRELVLPERARQLYLIRNWDTLAVLDKLDAQSLKSSNGVSGLTVGEMIAWLEQLDPTAPVLVPAENGGLDEVVLVTALGVSLNVNRAEGFGPHEVTASGEQPDTDAVLLLSAPSIPVPGA